MEVEKRGELRSVLALALILAVIFIGVSSADSGGISNAVLNSEEVKEPEQKLITQIIDLVVEPVEAVFGELVSISARLVYENDSPVTGEDIYFYADDMFIENGLSDDEGLASVIFDTSTHEFGAAEIKAQFEGNDFLLGSEEVTILDIIEEDQSGEIVTGNGGGPTEVVLFHGS